MADGFAVIPVLDLRGGQVVRARRGERASYAPIETPLAKGFEPGAVAAGIRAVLPAPILYVADLDAIVDGAPPDRESLAAIARACPGAALWVDAGFSELSAVEAFLAAGLGRPVLGSESQRDAGLVTALGERAVLSLDRAGSGRLGPASLHDDPSLWPREVIVMSLARIGAEAGPDLDGVAEARARAPGARLYAAGGVRGPEDLRALARLGAAGALVASAVHDGRLRADTLPARGANF